jgi:hypothetical protein
MFFEIENYNKKDAGNNFGSTVEKLYTEISLNHGPFKKLQTSSIFSFRSCLLKRLFKKKAQTCPKNLLS